MIHTHGSPSDVSNDPNSAASDTRQPLVRQIKLPLCCLCARCYIGTSRRCSIVLLYLDWAYSPISRLYFGVFTNNQTWSSALPNRLEQVWALGKSQVRVCVCTPRKMVANRSWLCSLVDSVRRSNAILESFQHKVFRRKSLVESL